MLEDIVAYCEQLLEQTAFLQTFTDEALPFDENVLPTTLTWQAPTMAEGQATFAEWWMPVNLQSSLQLSDRSTPVHSWLLGTTNIFVASESFQNLGVSGKPGAGKSTLAKFLARKCAQFFLEHKDGRVPILFDVTDTLPALERDLDHTLSQGNDVLLLVDGLGKTEEAWDSVRDLVARLDTNRVRLILFSESARAMNLMGLETVWLYISEIDGLEPFCPSGSLHQKSAIISRIGRAIGDVAAPDTLNNTSSLLIELFLSRITGGSGGPTLALMQATEDAALTLEVKNPEQAFWIRELIDAASVSSIDDGLASAHELQHLLPTGDVGRWLLEPVPGTPRYKFSHSLIKDALVLRALARRTNGDVFEILKRLPSGPTRARLATGIVDYLRETGENIMGEPRWRSLSQTICRDPDLMETGLLAAVRSGGIDGLPNGAKARFDTLTKSGNGLEKARSLAASGIREIPVNGIANMPPKTPRPDQDLEFVERARRALTTTPDSGFAAAVERMVLNGSLREGILDKKLVDRISGRRELWHKIMLVLDRRSRRSFLEFTARSRSGLERLLEVDRNVSDAETRTDVASVLGRILQADALAALEELAADPVWQVRRSSALSLGDRGSHIGGLLTLRNDAEPNVRLAVLSAALRSAAPWGRDIVQEGLDNGSVDEQAIICYALENPDPRQAATMRSFLQSDDLELKIAAAGALGESLQALQFMKERDPGPVSPIKAPGFHMELGQVLTEDSGGDLAKTRDWRKISMLGRLMSPRTLHPTHTAEIVNAGEAAIDILLRSGSAFDNESIVTKKFVRSCVDVIIKNHPQPRDFSSRLLGAISALDRDSIPALADVWSASLRHIPSSEICAYIATQAPNRHADIAAAVLLGRFSAWGIASNLLMRHEYVVLRSMPPKSTVEGILRAVEMRPLSRGSLSQAAELATDVLSRSDVALDADQIERASRLVQFVRDPTSISPQQLESTEWHMFSFAHALATAGMDLAAGRVREAAGRIQEIPESNRDRAWLMLRERSSFALGKFDEVVTAHQLRREGVDHVVGLFDRALLGARAANLAHKRNLARSFLGFSVGLNRDIVQAQALILDLNYLEASGLLRRWSARDLYAACLQSLATGDAEASLKVKMTQSSLETLLQLKAEFQHEAYSGAPGLKHVLQALSEEFVRRDEREGSG